MPPPGPCNTSAKSPYQSLPLRQAVGELQLVLVDCAVRCTSVALSTCASPSGSVACNVPVTVGALTDTHVGSDSSTMVGGVPEAPACAVLAGARLPLGRHVALGVIDAAGGGERDERRGRWSARTQ